MSFLSLVGVEWKKIRRSIIILLLALATIVLFVPSIFNAHMNFEMQAEGISPENNYFIQEFLGMVWFIYPASMVVITVMQNQIERGNKGILKMLSLPINTAKLCLAKFAVLVVFSAIQFLMSIGMYYICVAIISHTQNYDFFLSPLFVLKEAGLVWASSIPMLTFFWLLAVCIQTPIFSVGIGLASAVPSMLLINTKIWFAYPMAYPIYVLYTEYGKLATNITKYDLNLIPWLPVAIMITVVCLLISCIRFGQAERR